MKRLVAFLLAAVMCLTLAACAGGTKDNSTEQAEPAQNQTQTEPTEQASDSDTLDLSKLKIAGMPADASVGFFQSVAKGMEAAGEAFGVQLDIQYTSRDLNKEQTLTDTYLAQGYDGLVMNCSDSSAITGCLQKAADAGVPFISVDTTPERTDLAAGTVTSDNYAGGYAAGKLMMELLPEGGDIIMTKLEFASVAMDQRYQGFEDAIEGSNINVVDYIEQDGTREDTLTKIAPMLTKYDTLVGIYCTQGDPAIGALSAVDTAGLSDKITIISYDVEDEVAEAIKNGTTAQFRAKYREADVLLVDDIQFIAGRMSTQEEFFHTFEALHQANKQIVLTSDRPPKEITTLEERLRGRFEMGLLADVQPPDIDTRIAIVKSKSQQLGIPMTDEVAQYIAEQLKNNVRQLDGAVTRMRANLMMGDPMSISTAKSAIRDIRADSQPTPITVERIVSEVSHTLGVSPKDICSKSRVASISQARKIVVYVVRSMTDIPMQQIGEELGKRDHSTIVYAYQEAEKQYHADSSFRSLVDDIIKNIRSST